MPPASTWQAGGRLDGSCMLCRTSSPDRDLPVLPVPLRPREAACWPSVLLLISALGAGVFAGTRELARLLGEDEFSAVLHQGTRRSLLMCAANEYAIVVVLFSAEANLGLVKLYTPPAAESIGAVLAGAQARGEQVESVEHKFVLRDENLFELE